MQDVRSHNTQLIDAATGERRPKQWLVTNRRRRRRRRRLIDWSARARPDAARK